MSRGYLVVGQGLAGTAVAWRLWERKVPFLVLDRDEAQTSSKVAAGLLTPITGMRLNLNWRYDTLHPEALAFYRQHERRLGSKVFFPRTLVRYFRDEEAVALFEKRMEDPGYRAFVLGRVGPCAEFDSSFGGFIQKHAAYLDTKQWLDQSRASFQKQNAWEQAELTPGELDVQSDRVEWRGRSFEGVVFCTGWQAAQHPWFDWIPFTSARGSILEIDTELASPRRIINRGCWVLPRADGSVRAGASYEPRFGHPNEPGEKALGDLRGKLSDLLKLGFHELGVQTAVRPLVGRKPVLLGRHPSKDRVLFLNALGSKGALRAPWAARVLVDHLVDGQPIQEEIDLRQNLP